MDQEAVLKVGLTPDSTSHIRKTPLGPGSQALLIYGDVHISQQQNSVTLTVSCPLLCE